MEDWLPVEEFPGYVVSAQGGVRNTTTGKNMTQAVNQVGIPFVGLTRDRKQHRRAVSLLVAKSWIPERPNESFTTPINLDGDKLNCDVSNLLWRPRWFAMKYTQQFTRKLRAYSGPIEDTKSGEQFEDSWQAAMRYGLLDKEIYLSIVNHTFVWPTYQIFRTLARRY